MSVTQLEHDEQTRGVGPPEDSVTEGRELGEDLGRYALLGELGRGGMGVVLRAYDPKLQREVALKILRTDSISPEYEARLVREARAMAQLSHPNVVAIYDVELEQERVILAMEFVAGTTLREWARQTRRSVDDIIGCFVQAGRGLAAAHEEGLTHRDFKPTNVLVGDDGRVRVTDFGLARTDGRARPEPTRPPTLTSSGELALLDAELTRDGVIVGTPRYMAPEQHRDQLVTPATDQYSFCVALWEALAGDPPFASVETLVRDKMRGPPEWPKGTSVPSRVVDALRRGLSPRPESRWPSMTDLLAVLRVSPGRRRAALIGAGGFASLSGVLVWTAVFGIRDAEDSLCTGAADQLSGAWSDTRRGELETALLESNVTFAPEVWERISPRLDGYAQRWIEMHEDACAAANIRGEQSPEVMDLRMQCLHRAASDLRAATDVIAEARTDTIEHAHELVAGLPELARCADVEALSAEVPPPRASDRDAVERVRAHLSVARARREAAAFEGAGKALAKATLASKEVDYDPLLAELALERGLLAAARGEYDEAEAALRETRELGSRLGQWDAVREATVKLVFLVGHTRASPEEALAMGDVLRGLTAESPRWEGAARNNLATALSSQGRLEEAEAEFRRVIAIAEEHLSPDHEVAFEGRGNLASTLRRMGKTDEAELVMKEALDHLERAYGHEHPRVGMMRIELASLLRQLGRLDEAEAMYRDAMARLVLALGPDHPDLSAGHNNFSVLLYTMGKFEAAEQQARRALALRLEGLGPRSPRVAATRSNLASILAARGSIDEALQEQRETLKVLVETRGHDDTSTHNTRISVARLAHQAGRHYEAVQEQRAAVELRIAKDGADAPSVARHRATLTKYLLAGGELEAAQAEAELALRAMDRATPGDAGALALALLMRAKVHHARGEHALEREHLERAHTTRAKARGSTEERTRIDFALAEALAEDPADPARARSLAESALVLMGDAPRRPDDPRHEIEAWLEAR